MSKREILKKIEKLINAYNKRDAKALYEGLIALRERLLEDLEKEEQKKQEKEQKVLEKQMKVKPLIEWYMELWEKDPPEKYMTEKYYGVVGATFKALLNILGSEQSVKEEYERYYKTYRKGILAFRKSLVAIKKPAVKEWSAPEFVRGRDYYAGKMEVWE